MSRRRVPTAALIGAPTDVGASERGASMGPEALRVAGLARRLEKLLKAIQKNGKIKTIRTRTSAAQKKARRPKRRLP